MFESIFLIITDFLYNYGYISLFIVSLLSSTIIPMGPEVLIVAMFPTHDPIGIILVATAGGLCGSATTYLLGYWGVDKLSKRFHIIKPEKKEKARQLFSKYGKWILLFTFIPFIGDAVVFVAGGLKYKFLGLPF